MVVVVDADVPAKVPTPPSDAGNDEAEDGDRGPAGHIRRIIEGWKGLLTAAGAVGAAVVAKELTQNFGKGELDVGEMVSGVLAVVAFGLGVGILLTIPIVLTSRSRATMVDAVRLEKRRFGRMKIDPAVLYGYGSAEEFSQAMNLALTNARRYWERGLRMPPRVREPLTVFVQQSEQAQQHISANQLSAASRRAAVSAVAGMVLAVGGYGYATLVTNQGVRQGEVDDTATEARNGRIDKVLDHTLAKNSAASQVGFELPAAVVVTLPDAATAASVFGRPEIAKACWTERAGTVFDISPASQPEQTARVVQVALGPVGTECGAIVTRVEPVWIQAPPSAG